MYIKPISEFINDSEIVGAGGIADILAHETNCDNDFEQNSWRNSLPALAKVLKNLPESIKDECEIALEAGYCSDERADAVIIGRNSEHPVLVIIENKQWSHLSNYEPTGDMCLNDLYHDCKYVEQPCYQVSHYKYILDNTNGYVQDNNVSVYTAVFMHNASEYERERQVGPFDPRFDTVLKENPIFVGENGMNNILGLNISEYIQEKINGGTRGLAEAIYSSERKESDLYRNAIANLFGNRESLMRLLDDNQIAIFEEIKQRIFEYRDEKTVFIIKGDPGTGKTFVAAALIAYLYNQEVNGRKYSVKLRLKNRDPKKALRRMGMPDGAVKSSLLNDTNQYDCLICDEYHRMLEQVWKNKDNKDNIGAIIGKSNVSVFFYDSKQRVHIDDYVNDERIINKARESGISGENIIERTLEYQHRCLESDHFMQLMDRILYEPQRGLEGIAPFTEDETYIVRMINSPREMFFKIKELNDNRSEGMNGSRVLAGKGRTNGVDWKWMDDEDTWNTRKTIGPFRNDADKYVWNKSNYTDTDSFASNDASVNLVGCLDTSQGLDFEYVGLIFSPDIVYDAHNNSVRIDLNGHQQGDPNLRIVQNRNKEELLKTIIRNTYRVLSSRGAKGCFIYCCDEGLQNYLGTLIPTMNVDVPDDYVTYPSDTVPSNTVNVMYIGNRNNRSFHKPDCEYAPRKLEKRIEFTSRGEAFFAGYKPCGTCKP